MIDYNIIIAVYYIIINLIELLFMFSDKQRAIRHKYRIPEKTLLALSVFGGCIGLLLGMHLFRHKTKKWYFHLVLWLSILIHILIAAFVNFD